MTFFKCPVCGKLLEEIPDEYKCPDGHSFDIAREGYVNLLAPAGHGKVPGDNPIMVSARRRFLDCGYYENLRRAVAETVSRLNFEHNKNIFAADAGCGEGYYTSGIAAALDLKGISASAAGIDISKRAVKAAAKRYKNVRFAVAGIFDMPFPDGCADVLTSIFAPICKTEFLRVVKPGGYLVIVSPGRNHLFGLKKLLYEKPYLNEEKEYRQNGFVKVRADRVKSRITVKGGGIRDLFAMTPYYYNTDPDSADRLSHIDSLDTDTDFIVTVLQKSARE